MRNSIILSMKSGRFETLTFQILFIVWIIPIIAQDFMISVNIIYIYLEAITLL